MRRPVVVIVCLGVEERRGGKEKERERKIECLIFECFECFRSVKKK